MPFHCHVSSNPSATVILYYTQEHITGSIIICKTSLRYVIRRTEVYKKIYFKQRWGRDTSSIEADEFVSQSANIEINTTHIETNTMPLYGKKCKYPSATLDLKGNL